ncbi:hypothetical protein NM008_004116 [Vibrio parahaemolyticus]|nr:hypothetical protein [Vibrio parahaemolyticus]
MRYVVTLFLLLLPTTSTLADDSETNPVAKKIKSTLQKKVDKQFDQYDGYRGFGYVKIFSALLDGGKLTPKECAE